MRLGSPENGRYCSDLTLEEQDSAIKAFKDGLSKVMITTNALACGVLWGVNVVINFDVPTQHSKNSVWISSFLLQSARTCDFVVTLPDPSSPELDIIREKFGINIYDI